MENLIKTRAANYVCSPYERVETRLECATTVGRGERGKRERARPRAERDGNWSGRRLREATVDGNADRRGRDREGCSVNCGRGERAGGRRRNWTRGRGRSFVFASFASLARARDLMVADTSYAKGGEGLEIKRTCLNVRFELGVLATAVSSSPAEF